MKKNIYIHLGLLLLVVAAFYSVGMIDRARLAASNVDTRKVLIFSQIKGVLYDGGSIRHESFVYSAFESRRMEPVNDEEGKVIGYWHGYQGFTWKWHHWNNLWIAAPLAINFLIVARRLRMQKKLPTMGSTEPLTHHESKFS